MFTRRELRRSNGIVRLKELPWVMASLDRTIVGEDGLVEIKTSTSPRWSLHPVPPEVVAQVQWQMFVTGAPWCDIAVLLGGLVFRIERVEADLNYQTQLYAKAVEFRNLLATDTPPTLQGEDSDALAQVVPQTSEEYAQADTSLDRLAALYAEKQYESRLLDQELQNLAIGLKESIGEKVGIADAVLPRELEDGSLMLLDGHLRVETMGDQVLPVLVLAQKVPAHDRQVGASTSSADELIDAES